MKGRLRMKSCLTIFLIQKLSVLFSLSIGLVLAEKWGPVFKSLKNIGKMKFQIDTSAKTIRLEQSANIAEFVELIKTIFPEGEWKNYTLETNVVINNWSNPIYIDRCHHWPYNW